MRNLVRSSDLTSVMWGGTFGVSYGEILSTLPHAQQVTVIVDTDGSRACEGSEPMWGVQLPVTATENQVFTVTPENSVPANCAYW